jgi:hypothetical protein
VHIDWPAHALTVTGPEGVPVVRSLPASPHDNPQVPNQVDTTPQPVSLTP